MISEVLTQLGYRVSDAQQLSARVWSAWHTECRRWDCLKFAQSAEHCYGIRREAYWLKELHRASYQACAAFQGHYQLSGYEVLVTGRLNAEPLSELLRQGFEFHAEFRLQLYLTLQQLHRLDICHGDLKPANIMVVDNRPVLVDFASAAALDTRISELSYRSFSPSYSLPALQRGVGAVDIIHDWYGYLVILSLISNAAFFKPDWSDSAAVITTADSLLSVSDDLTIDARQFLAHQIQRLPDFK